MIRLSQQLFRIFGLGLLAVSCLGLKSSWAYSDGDEQQRPNVVIFLTDDQGTLDVNCYGSRDLDTPTMDSLAEDGIRFTQAYAHMVCCPARAMLMTGRYPQRSNVNMWTQGNAQDEKKGRNMLREEITIAEVLRSAGYKTALFGKWHLGAHRDHGPTEQGFEEFFGLRGGFIDNYNHHFLHGHGFHDLYEGKQEVFAGGEYFPDLITKRALQYIDKHKQVPFFMYVAFNIPHYPEQAAAEFTERYRKLEMPRRSYAKMISTTDHCMGKIMERLELHDLKDSTIVVFMSDNGHSNEDYKIRGKNHTSGLPEGTNYGANGGGGHTGKWRGHKGTFFEGGIRVPAIISYPARIPQGQVRDQAITAMDWLPTILDLCEIEQPSVKLDGKSLLPVIESAATASPHSELHWQWGTQWAVRQGNWKLIGTGDEIDFLGNLADPAPEMTNYRDEKPSLTQQLQALHKDWLQAVSMKNQE